MIQKATELGVTKFIPILTDRTIVRKLNYKRINKIIIEASEQSNRLEIPEFDEIIKLDKFISSTEYKSIEPSSMRKIIAERTTATKNSVPHFYLTIESNVDKLLKLRKNINDQYNDKVSINDILVKALAIAQKNNPKTNVSWHNGKIIQYSSVDISIAVALDEGLITPIIKNADIKGL